MKSEDYSPLASTEEKSIHDNINLNKQSLEKGLRNRPNQYVLVDRGILRNPGKAFSDKMSQLDLAKKRDKLKVKIANRPEREELVRKLILQEQSDSRQKKFDKIKEILDDSINNRPGSLELVGKNILQVDRLLASRIQSGEITYPKVCGVDSNFTDSLSSNHSTPLPSISEIDIPNTLNELSDLQSSASLLSTKSNSNRSLQYSYKKTCRVGRYSFHNIEFRPAAQKAREYQQNQLVQFEEIQAQRNPNLKRIHSELATKSHNSDVIHESNCSVPKHSLLHRLNVHELKSECKIRMIPCSNIPKVQLVEKLLPYESEILASHTSFDSLNHGCSSSQSNRRSMPVIKSTRDFSPPENNINSNICNALCNPSPNGHSLSNNIFGSQNCSKMIHSRSEPLIQNFINSPQPVSSFINVTSIFPMSTSVENSNFNFIKLEDNTCLNHQQPFNQFMPNNAYSNLHFHQPIMNMSNESYPMKQQNLVFQSNPFDNRHLNGWANLNKNSLHSQPSDSISQIHLFNDQMELESDFTAQNSHNFNMERDCLPIILSPEVNLSSVQLDCGKKFDKINDEISKMNGIIESIKWISRDKQQNSKQIIDKFKMVKMNVIKHINDMINFIDEEIKLNIIDVLSAQNQKNWLNNLRISVQSINIECVKMENDYSKSNVDDILNNNNGIRYFCQNNQINDLDLELLNNHSNPRQNDQFFLEPLLDDEIDQFDLNELKIPETPLNTDSPLYNNDLDEFFYDLLNVTENIIS